jgi:hypothetical protein
MFPQFNVIESYARDFQPAPVTKPGSLTFLNTTEKGGDAKFFSKIPGRNVIVISFTVSTYGYLREVDPSKLFLTTPLSPLRRYAREFSH